MSDKLLFDTDGAAEMLSMSRASVERIAAEGDLPSVKVRGMRRFRRSDIEAFVEGLGQNDDAASLPQLTAHAGNHGRDGRRQQKRTARS